MNDYSLQKFLRSPFPGKILPYLLLLFAALGFFDAAYLTIVHFQHVIPPCTVGGCETVLTSTYASLGQIPIALIGAGFYLLILILSGIFLTIPPMRYLITRLIFIFCAMGLLVGLGLIGIQAFILHSFCYYCLFSELIDFLLFDTSWWLLSSKEK